MTALLLILFSFYWILQISVVQTLVAQKFANALSKQFKTSITVQRVDFDFFNKLILEEVLVEDNQHDSLFYVGKLSAGITKLSLRKKQIALGKIKTSDVKAFVAVSEEGVPNYQFILDALKTDKPSNGAYNVLCDDFEFEEAQLVYQYWEKGERKKIELQNIFLDISDFRVQKDQMSLQIKGMHLEDGKGFKINGLSTLVSSEGSKITFEDFNIKTMYSEIVKANFILEKGDTVSDKGIDDYSMDLDIRESLISFKDVGKLFPALRGMDQDVKISGRVYGKLSDLKGKNIVMQYGENTRLNCDAYLSGLPDIDETYMHVDLKKSFADFNDFKNFSLPGEGHVLSFPDAFSEAGILEYTGNFTGFLSDFVAYGTLRSKMGVLKTDLSFVPMKNNDLRVEGHLKTVNFRLGELFLTDRLGNITFNGNIDGILNEQSHSFIATVVGEIDSIEMNDYVLQRIRLDGDVRNKRFDGRLAINDQNLQMRFNGSFDFNLDVPVFDFEMTVDNANLNALQLDHTYRQSEIGLLMRANFSGNSIDNLVGNIVFDGGHYSNSNGSFFFDGVELKTYKDEGDVLLLNADFMDVSIVGDYHFKSLYNSVKTIVAHYLPSSGMNLAPGDENNSFHFRIEMKDMKPVTEVLSPDWQVDPSTISGSINSNEFSLNLEALFPRISYKQIVFNELDVRVEGMETLDFRSRFDNIEIGDLIKIYNLALLSEVSNDKIESKLVWNNFHEKSYSGSVNTTVRFSDVESTFPHVEIEVEPSRLFVADTLWNVSHGMVTIDSSKVKVSGLKVSNKQQSVSLEGLISDRKGDKMELKFNHLDLSNLNMVFTENMDIHGEIDGSVSFLDFYKQAYFLSDIQINRLSLLNQDIGDVKVYSEWDPLSEKILSEFRVSIDGENTLLARGNFIPQKNYIDFTAELNDFSLLVLEPVLKGSFTNIHGRATGELRIFGTSDHIRHNGRLLGSNAGLMLTHLQANYTFNDDVIFRGDSIVFDHVKIFDEYGNTADFDGSIKHHNFRNMIYDLSITTPKILAINTTSAINEQFYGKAFGSGIVKVTGFGRSVYIDGVVKTEKGTELNIALDYEGKAQEYDFVRFIGEEAPELEEKASTPYSQSNVNISFDVEITPDAKAQLIYNSQVGDVIRSYGSGYLQIFIDKDFNISIYGDYLVDRGDYLFTLQNVINKRFDIEQGGTIVWNGDPYDATIDLNAIYRLKTSLYELYKPYESSSENIDKTQRVPVNCKIHLQNNLNNPDIRFDIELPTAEDRVKDQIRQFINTEEDMNKQILSLLVLGKFYTPEYLRGTYEASSGNSNVVGTTASELLSNQFSNWLSQISNEFDFGFNYRPGNQISNDEVELALSTQFFNDRVTINGNVSNNSSSLTTSNNSSALIGEFDVNVKLTGNGKVQLKAYNHANNNLIYETSPYTQGVGISYREDFNTLQELWTKITAIFRKEKVEE